MIKIVQKIDRILTPIITPFLKGKTKRLVIRRQGVISHIKLSKRFREIRRKLI